MMEVTWIHWLLSLSLGALALGCLILGIRQFITVKYPLQSSDQARRSLTAALWFSLLFTFAVALSGVFVWAETGKPQSVLLVSPILCMTPFVFGITGLGTYVQFFWYGKLSKYREDLIEKQIARFETQDRESRFK